MKTPVLFMVYKRPEITQLVFNEIRKAAPKYLFVAADGPKQGEEEKCLAVRNIVTKVDWPCELEIKFQGENLGGKWGGYTALDWFFSHVDEGIILEDDDLPDQSFFTFCKYLLRFYRDSDLIGTISGDNFQFGNNPTPNSYYFSKFFHGWGWATWKKMWDLFDIRMMDWPNMRTTEWYGQFLDFPKEAAFWTNTLDRMYAGYPNAWDYQFSYCLWKHQKLNIIPCKNLVTNIGLIDSTHAMSVSNPMVNQKRQVMDFLLRHPPTVERYIKADKFSVRYYC